MLDSIEQTVMEHSHRIQALEKMLDKEVAGLNKKIDTEIQSAAESRRMIYNKLDSQKNWFIGILLTVIAQITTTFIAIILKKVGL